MNLPAVPEFGTMLDEPASDEDITDDEEGHEDDEEDDRVSSIADEEKDTPDSRNLSANSMHVSETNVRLISDSESDAERALSFRKMSVR